MTPFQIHVPLFCLSDTGTRQNLKLRYTLIKIVFQRQMPNEGYRALYVLNITVTNSNIL